jgi:hypothetical protein
MWYEMKQVLRKRKEQGKKKKKKKKNSITIGNNIKRNSIEREKRKKSIKTI